MSLSYIYLAKIVASFLPNFWLGNSQKKKKNFWLGKALACQNFDTQPIMHLVLELYSITNLQFMCFKNIISFYDM